MNSRNGYSNNESTINIVNGITITTTISLRVGAMATAKVRI